MDMNVAADIRNPCSSVCTCFPLREVVPYDKVQPLPGRQHSGRGSGAHHAQEPVQEDEGQAKGQLRLPGHEWPGADVQEVAVHDGQHRQLSQQDGDHLQSRTTSDGQYGCRGF